MQRKLDCQQGNFNYRYYFNIPIFTLFNLSFIHNTFTTLIYAINNILTLYIDIFVHQQALRLEIYTSFY